MFLLQHLPNHILIALQLMPKIVGRTCNHNDAKNCPNNILCRPCYNQNPKSKPEP